jgi:hypothetical protein
MARVKENDIKPTTMEAMLIGARDMAFVGTSAHKCETMWGYGGGAAG